LKLQASNTKKQINFNHQISKAISGFWNIFEICFLLFGNYSFVIWYFVLPSFDIRI